MHDIIVRDEGYSGLNPVQFGYENCEKSHHFGPAVRTYWLIHFVVSGCGIYRIKDKTYPVGAGEMFVIPPFEETYYEADEARPWSYIWIGFTSDSPLPKELDDTIKCPEAKNIFEYMKNCVDYSNGRSSFLCARLWDLFALLKGKESVKYDYVQRTLEYIHSEYMNDVTVEKMAQRVNLERTYFSVLFKEKMGVSPKQYLIDYRMNVAASLIIKKDISIAVAACSVGYSDLFTFSKMFKRHFGVSPTEYASRNRIV